MAKHESKTAEIISLPNAHGPQPNLLSGKMADVHNAMVDKVYDAIAEARQAGLPQAMIVGMLDNMKFSIQYEALLKHNQTS